MSWVRRQTAPVHTCMFPAPALGRRGDLWRCPDCEVLWRVGLACDVCDTGLPHTQGTCTVGTKWRRAGLWERIRYFGKGREVGPETIWPEDQESRSTA